MRAVVGGVDFDTHGEGRKRVFDAERGCFRYE